MGDLEKLSYELIQFEDSALKEREEEEEDTHQDRDASDGQTHLPRTQPSLQTSEELGLNFCNASHGMNFILSSSEERKQQNSNCFLVGKGKCQGNFARQQQQSLFCQEKHEGI